MRTPYRQTTPGNCPLCGSKLGEAITRHGFTKRELQRARKEIQEFNEGKREPIFYQCCNPDCDAKEDAP